MSVTFSKVQGYVTIRDGNKDRRVSFQSLQPAFTGTAVLPVIICIPSLGDLCEEYRFITPLLAARGHRVMIVDHRGLGESDVEFTSYAAHYCGSDVVALIKQEIPLNQKVVIIGNSMGGAAAVWVASELPRQVDGIVLLDAFVRDHPFPFGMQTLLSFLCSDFIGPMFWPSYYAGLHTLKPSTVPDLKEYCSHLKKNLQQPGRMRAVREQLFASKQQCTARLPVVQQARTACLAIFGDKDPDFAKPEDEAKWIVQNLRGKEDSEVYYEMIRGAGHYPHVEAPDQVMQHIDSFLAKIREAK